MASRTDSEKVWIFSTIHLSIKISIRSLDPVGEMFFLKFINRKSGFQGSLNTNAMKYFEYLEDKYMYFTLLTPGMDFVQ